MKKFNFKDCAFVIDIEKTKDYYRNSNGFVCECTECIEFYTKIPSIQEEFKKLNLNFGIDFSKDVGLRGDELCTHTIDKYNLAVLPYYVFGKFEFTKKETENKLTFTDQISVTFEDMSYQKWFDEDAPAFKLGLEFNYEIKKKSHENSPSY